MALPELTDYAVRIPPGSNSDALCETLITWKNGDKEFITRGLIPIKPYRPSKPQKNIKHHLNLMQLKIALLAGDGIGPEVIDQAVKVCDAIAQKFNHDIQWMPALTGAAAIDAVGEPYPYETHEICVSSDAVLFGAIGHPRFDNDPSAKVRPEQGLLKMRAKTRFVRQCPPYLTFPSLIDKSP